jgi:hypothetical protein
MKICDHEYEQAAQCASIVHNSGKCDVKYGDVDTISTMKDKLKSLGLSVTMEIISNKRIMRVFFVRVLRLISIKIIHHSLLYSLTHYYQISNQIYHL